MVVMQTRAVVSRVLPVRCWTMYSSVNLQLLYGRDELLEFLERLVAEVAAIHQEQHAPRAGELDEPIDEVDGGVGLAAAGGHLDQGAGTVLSQRLFEILDGGDLRGPEAAGAQGGMCPQASAESRCRFCGQGRAACRSFGASLRCSRIKDASSRVDGS